MSSRRGRDRRWRNAPGPAVNDQVGTEDPRCSVRAGEAQQESEWRVMRGGGATREAAAQ